MHLKRLAAPRAWRLQRKEKKFAVRAAPGPHDADRSMPLMLVIRDVLGYAKNEREAKKILNERKVLVDGRIRTDYKFPVGLMDVIHIRALEKAWTALVDRRGKFVLTEIPPSKANTKLCKIVGKSLVNGGNLQLNLHDGRNILIKVNDPKKPKEDVYKTKDTVVLDLAKNDIKKTIAFEKGNLAFITGGSHVGRLAKIEDYKVLRSPQPNTVTLSSDSEKFETLGEYVFVVGEKRAAIPMGELK